MNVKKVRLWMVANDVRPKDIKESLGYTQYAPVSQTINGKKRYQRVVDELIRRGCPASYFEPRGQRNVRSAAQ